MVSPPRGFRPENSIGLALACAWLLGQGLAFPAAAGAQSTSGPQAGVLVLRGGEVVRGKISRVGESYHVAFGNEGEMRLPASAIDVYAVDLDDAYRQLLARTDVEDAGRQLALAQWCLRQDLLKQAADRLLAATLLTPDHPGIASVEARLWLATHPTNSASPSKPPSDPSPSSRPEQTTAARTWQTVPPGAIESFTSGVQPLLLNRCAGCHRPGSGLSFQLLRPLAGRPISRNFTERNLAAVLAVCDRENPVESPLLAVPRAAHGGAKPIIHSNDAAQWENVAGWIAGLTDSAEVRLASTATRREGVLWQPAHAAGAIAPQATQTAAPSSAAGAPAAMKTPTAPAVEGPPPRDPFDPEIFNRRYGKTPDPKDEPKDLGPPR